MSIKYLYEGIQLRDIKLNCFQFPDAEYYFDVEQFYKVLRIEGDSAAKRHLESILDSNPRQVRYVQIKDSDSIIRTLSIELVAQIINTFVKSGDEYCQAVAETCIFEEIYSIEQVSEQTAVVFANSYVNPISYLHSIEEQLIAMNFSGEVVFDLLLSNGEAFNRIVTSSAVEGKVDRKAFKTVDFSVLDESVAGKIKAFYRYNEVLVHSNLILSDEEKEALLR